MWAELPGRAVAVADLRTAASNVVGAEEGERMVDRHERQVLARHLGNQPSPQAGTDDHMVGKNGAAGGHDT